MLCPGCVNNPNLGTSPIPGAVPASDNSGDWKPCPLCGPYGTPGLYPGGGVGYAYQVPFSLPNSAPASLTIQIRVQNDFLWQAAIATRSGTFTTLIQVNQVQIQTVYNVAGNIDPRGGVLDTNFWGTNANPFPLFTPIPLKANDYVTFTVVDTSGSFPNVISLYLLGANYDAGSFSPPTLTGTSTGTAINSNIVPNAGGISQ